MRLLDDFGVRVIEPDGRVLTPEHLSRGAQDQLALALRIAIADHVTDDVRLPLVLDDPFLHWDAARRERAARRSRVGAERQVVLLSHDAASRHGAWRSPSTDGTLGDAPYRGAWWYRQPSRALSASAWAATQGISDRSRRCARFLVERRTVR